MYPLYHTLLDHDKLRYQISSTATLMVPNDPHALLWEIVEQVGQDDFIRRVFFVSTDVEEMALLRRLIKISDPVVMRALNTLSENMKEYKRTNNYAQSLHYDRIFNAPYIKTLFFKSP